MEKEHKRLYSSPTTRPRKYNNNKNYREKVEANKLDPIIIENRNEDEDVNITIIDDFTSHFQISPGFGLTIN